MAESELPQISSCPQMRADLASGTAAPTQHTRPCIGATSHLDQALVPDGSRVTMTRPVQSLGAQLELAGARRMS